MENASSKRTTLSPIIKWAGGKESELDIIHRYAPESFDTFYEPFVGGGSVFMSFNAKSYKINDFSKELINLIISQKMNHQYSSEHHQYQ